MRLDFKYLHHLSTEIWYIIQEQFGRLNKFLDDQVSKYTHK